MPELIDKRETIRLIQDRFCSECYTKGECDGCEYKYCIEAVEDAPTIDAEPAKWIPCSERLPEQEGQYLVTTVSGKVYIRSFYFSLSSKRPYFSGDEKVIAWIPLPEPPESEVQDDDER